MQYDKCNIPFVYNTLSTVIWINFTVVSFSQSSQFVKIIMCKCLIYTFLT